MKNSPKKTIPDEFKGGRYLKAIQKNRNLDLKEFVIMNFLASLCDLGEDATFEEERKFKRKFLAHECRMSLSSLERKSKQLADKGYIILTENFKESGGQDSNLYRLTRKVFDEYLETLVDTPPRLGDDPPLVWETTPPRQGDDTIHNYSLHNDIKHNHTTFVASVDHSSAHARMIEEIEILQSFPDEPKPVNERSDKPKKVLSEDQKKSITLCSQIFILDRCNRTPVYEWMDKILSRHGERAVRYFEPLIEYAGRTEKYKPTKVNMAQMKKNIENLTKDQQ